MDNLENSLLEPYINLQGLLSQKINQQSKTDFLTFVRMMAPTLVSGWKMGRHIELISDKLKELEDGTIKRLMVFLPPRSSKSVICSKLFPAWYIGRHYPNAPELKETVGHDFTDSSGVLYTGGKKFRRQ